MEPVRLVIWDLDETFWKGTVTEGGHIYSQQAHDIVIELARRGIMSAICSKNDFDPIKEILVAAGIWDYFIFPSINWESKGPRLAKLVEAVGLRPPTILFVDDNPMNLAEATHFVPGIQTSDETIVGRMLDDPLFKGKDDSALTRLKQYKLLEERKLDEVAAGGDNRAFLKTSEIRVIIDHDVTANLDRAIELINRTNQLNFTKQRLPEDMEAARAELSELLRSRRVQAGLVRVKDRYGDYGYVGFYAVRGGAGAKRLMHFCFSCRTLGMAVESWLYQRLGRPYMKVVGEVLNDVTKDDREIDWITFAGNGDDSGTEVIDKAYKYLILRGGCELHAVGHYLEPAAEVVHDEMLANPMLLTNHSNFLKYAITGQAACAAEVLKPLGYGQHHFETAALDHLNSGERGLLVMAFWSDGRRQLYRHRSSGLAVPFKMEGLSGNLLKLEVEEVEVKIGAEKAAAFKYFKEEFDDAGSIDPASFEETIRQTLEAAPSTLDIVVLLAPETKRVNEEVVLIPKEVALNERVRLACEGRPGVIIVRPEDFESDMGVDRIDFHFERDFYWAVASHILERLAKQGSLSMAA